MKYTKITSYKYELHEDISVPVPELSEYYFYDEYFSIRCGVIFIYKGYAWDGVSGPTIDTKNTFVAGLVHDALYQAIRTKHLPKSEKITADKIFRRLLREHGMSWFRSQYFYLGVKWFGKSHIRPKKGGEDMEKVFEA
jgi:hypothetical protein